MPHESAVPAREPHWLPTTARTALVDAVTAHLQRLGGLDPDRFTLSDVLIELGVASARSHLDQVPADLLRAAAGITEDACQIRLSNLELAAIRRVPNLPMKVQDAFRFGPTHGINRNPNRPPETR